MQIFQPNLLEPKYQTRDLTLNTVLFEAHMLFVPMMENLLQVKAGTTVTYSSLTNSIIRIGYSFLLKETTHQERCFVPRQK